MEYRPAIKDPCRWKSYSWSDTLRCVLVLNLVQYRPEKTVLPQTRRLAPPQWSLPIKSWVLPMSHRVGKNEEAPSWPWVSVFSATQRDWEAWWTCQRQSGRSRAPSPLCGVHLLPHVHLLRIFGFASDFPEGSKQNIIDNEMWYICHQQNPSVAAAASMASNEWVLGKNNGAILCWSGGLEKGRKMS